jgi:hypothetical protein
MFGLSSLFFEIIIYYLTFLLQIFKSKNPNPLKKEIIIISSLKIEKKSQAKKMSLNYTKPVQLNSI